MRINIAGESIQLSVGFDEQDFVRDTERRIAGLFDTWRERFPSKSSRELLAMMTYQYASYYLTLSRRQDDMMAGLAECDSRLDDIILSLDSPARSGHPALLD